MRLLILRASGRTGSLLDEDVRRGRTLARNKTVESIAKASWLGSSDVIEQRCHERRASSSSGKQFNGRAVAFLGPVPGRARLGNGARRLQRSRRRMGLFAAR